MHKIPGVILGAAIGTNVLLVVGVIANAIYSKPPKLMNRSNPKGRYTSLKIRVQALTPKLSS